MTMTIQTTRSIRYKGGTTIPKGEVLTSEGITPSPVLDRAKSHPRVWGEYVWKDVDHHTVRYGGSLYAVPATACRELATVTTIRPGTDLWIESEKALEQQRKRGG